jgi:hypothetical protein
VATVAIAPPGSVPGAGERLCLTTLSDGHLPAAAYPAPEATPWTHGDPRP